MCAVLIAAAQYSSVGSLFPAHYIHSVRCTVYSETFLLRCATAPCGDPLVNPIALFRFLFRVFSSFKRDARPPINPSLDCVAGARAQITSLSARWATFGQTFVLYVWSGIFSSPWPPEREKSSAARGKRNEIKGLRGRTEMRLSYCWRAALLNPFISIFLLQK